LILALQRINLLEWLNGKGFPDLPQVQGLGFDCVRTTVQGMAALVFGKK